MAKSDSDTAKADRFSAEEHLRWLETVWGGDTRELTRGRYLHQQADLAAAFDESPFWTRAIAFLRDWSDEYRAVTGFGLFPRDYTAPTLDLKPWESFLSRSWRNNVRSNDRFPLPPERGWFLPDNWLERSWDIVRTRFVVRYLDGVEWLASKLENEAASCGLAVDRVTHAQEWGYYAMHVVVSIEFDMQALDYGEPDHRRSRVELQITTELQEVIGQLTHHYFERRREEAPATEGKWQWDYSSEEFTPNYLGHLLHYLEGMIMHVRGQVAGLSREVDPD